MDIHETQIAVQQELAQHSETMIQFLRELVAIPSYDSQIGPVGDAIGARMADLGFDEVRRDSMGNILGRIGNGPRTLLYDSHIDTVSIADASQWQWDPFQGKYEHGIIYGLGAGDEKCSNAAHDLRAGDTQEVGAREGLDAVLFWQYRGVV